MYQTQTLIVLILKFLQLVAVTFLTLGRVRMKMLKIWMLMHQIWPGQPNFGDVTVDPFEQDIGSSLPENFDVSAATPLNYFELLFKPEMFREIVTHTNNYAVFKRDETRAQKYEPDYIDNMWVNTSVDEMRAFFGMNVINGHQQSTRVQVVLAQRLISWQCWYKTNNASEEVWEALPIPPCIRQNQWA